MDDVMSLSSAGVSLDSKDSQGRTAWRLQQLTKFEYPNALHMAAANGHLDIVEYLLQNGADVNASNTEKNTPLHWACLNGHTEVARALIRGGASVSMLNSYDRTPMDEAVSQGKLELVDAINAAVAEFELNGVEVS